MGPLWRAAQKALTESATPWPHNPMTCSGYFPKRNEQMCSHKCLDQLCSQSPRSGKNNKVSISRRRYRQMKGTPIANKRKGSRHTRDVDELQGSMLTGGGQARSVTNDPT